MNHINIVVTLHDKGDGNYIRALAAMYASLRTHTQEILKIYIIHDETVSEENIRILYEYISRQDFIEFVNINKFPHIAQISRKCYTGRFSPAVIWRVYLPDICPMEKAIVCDADLIFLFNIKELWNINIDNSAIAAVPRTKPRKEEYHSLIKTPPSRYFRMTVTLMNLNYMRTNELFLAERDNFLLYKLPQINEIARLNEQSLFNYYNGRAFSDQ